MAGVISPVSLAVNTWLPGDNNLLAASYPVQPSQSTQAMTAGTIYLIKVKVPVTIKISTIWLFSNGAAGSGASTGSFVGVYNSAGTRLGVSADCATQFGTSFNTISVPLLAATTVPPPFAWIAILSNLAVTQPTLATAQGNGNLVNLGLTAATYSFCTNGTGTALPVSITPASNSLTGAQSFWTGAS